MDSLRPHRQQPHRNRGGILLAGFLLFAGLAAPAAAQRDGGARGSRNVTVVSHLPLGGMQPVGRAASAGLQGLGRRTGDVAVEQEMDRPYAYVAQRHHPAGFVVINLADPAAPQMHHRWSLPNPGDDGGARDVKAFKVGGRYYVAQAFQFEGGSAADDLGAVVFDVTSLPDAAGIREVARLRGDGGFHSLFAYKKSDGRALLMATGGGDIHVYDLAQVVAGETGLVGRLTTPDQLEVSTVGFEDMVAAYHIDSEQDRLYAAGAGGYYVYNITDPAAPVLLAQINSAAVQRGRALSVSPDGRWVVAAAGYRTAPLRIFDLQPALDGTIPRVRTAVGAWTANWQHVAQNHQMRWPFVFVAAQDDGFQVFNMLDPVNPYTDAFYHTWDGPPGRISDPHAPPNGAWDVDVRNADGLVLVTDLNTGLWVFRLEAFRGWDGRGWGLPNISTVQDWDHGPLHADQW